MPRVIRVYYPSGRQLRLPMKKWMGLHTFARDDDLDLIPVVMTDLPERNDPIFLLDPRAIVVAEDTGEWLYNPRRVKLSGDFGKWMAEHPDWGTALPKWKGKDV